MGLILKGSPALSLWVWWRRWVMLLFFLFFAWRNFDGRMGEKNKSRLWVCQLVKHTLPPTIMDLKNGFLQYIPFNYSIPFKKKWSVNLSTIFSASHGWGKASKRMRWMTKRLEIQDRIALGGIPGHPLKLQWFQCRSGEIEAGMMVLVCFWTRKHVGQCSSGRTNNFFQCWKSPIGRWWFASYGCTLVIDFGRYSRMDLMDVRVWSVNM